MIHILCMVKDGDKYLPDFIAHHLRLVDRIWFIDHSSSNSLETICFIKFLICLTCLQKTIVNALLVKANISLEYIHSNITIVTPIVLLKLYI